MNESATSRTKAGEGLTDRHHFWSRPWAPDLPSFLLEVFPYMLQVLSGPPDIPDIGVETPTSNSRLLRLRGLAANST